MPFEMRERMRKTGGVIPHFAGIDDMTPQFTGYLMMQSAIGIGMRAVEHGGRHGPILWPVGAGLFVIAIDAAGGQYHGRRLKLHVLAGFIIDAVGAGHDTAALL